MNAIAALLFCLQEPTPPPPPKQEEKKVVIIGQRREGDILDVPSAVTVVTADQIRESGATNIVEVMQKQTGFFSAGPHKGAHDQVVDLRGYNNGSGNGQRTLVLVDGRKTNSVVSTSTDWAAIPLENIERIEIVRGPAAALYGDGALAGAINIITKRGGKEAFSRVSASGGNWGTRRESANLGGAAGPALFDLFAGVETTEGFRDHSDFLGNTLTGRFELPLTESLLGHVKVGRHDDRRERPGSLSKAEIAALGREASVLAGSPSEHSGFEEYVDGGLVQALGELGELTLFLNHTRTAGDTVFFGGFGDFAIDDESEISLLQVKHVVRPKLFGQASAFTTGVDLSYESAEADSAFGGPPGDESEYRRRLLGAYEHVEVRPLEFLALTVSLRYDRALLNLDSDPAFPAFGGEFDRQRAFDQLSPHAGVTVKLLEEVSTYAAWGRTFKYPTRDELIGFTTSEPSLDPERAETVEAGARFHAARWGSAGVSAYRMEVKDEIFLDSSLSPPFGENVNFDEVTHQGIESDVRFLPVPELELFATHAYTRAVITESDNPAQEGKRYPVTPRLAGTAGATVRFEGAAVTLLGRYAGDRYLVNDTANARDTLDSYWVLDLRVAYTWKLLTGFVSVYNLTDRDYYDNGGVTSAGAERFSPAAERSWLVGADLTF